MSSSIDLAPCLFVPVSIGHFAGRLLTALRKSRVDDYEDRRQLTSRSRGPTRAKRRDPRIDMPAFSWTDAHRSFGRVGQPAPGLNLH